MLINFNDNRSHRHLHYTLLSLPGTIVEFLSGARAEGDLHPPTCRVQAGMLASPAGAMTTLVVGVQYCLSSLFRQLMVASKDPTRIFVNTTSYVFTSLRIARIIMLTGTHMHSFSNSNNDSALTGKFRDLNSSQRQVNVTRWIMRHGHDYRPGFFSFFLPRQTKDCIKQRVHMLLIHHNNMKTIPK